MPAHHRPIAVKEGTAAVMLDMTAAQFRRLVGSGALPPPCKIGGVSRWRVADLEAILNGNERTPEDDDDFE